MGGFFNPHSFERTKRTPTRIPQCGKCGLAPNCLSPKMEPQGLGNRRILFVGDTPSASCDQLGELFNGEAGELLRNVLHSIGVDLDDCILTNAVICHTDTVEPYMISACRPSPLKAIRTLKPNVIIPLGIVPLQSLLYGIWEKEMGGEEKWVGWRIPIGQFGAWLCPTFSLSYVLKHQKDPSIQLAFRKHLERAISKEHAVPQFVSAGELEDQVEIVSNPLQARNRMKDLATAEGTLAFDYETTGLKPDRKRQKIVSVSFCLNGNDTWACMLEPRLMPYLSKVLLNRRTRKVASNLKFEERWTLAKLGHGVAEWHWDTMLTAHALDNRPGITSVKFQGFVLLGLPDYDSHISPYLKARDSNSLNRILDLSEHDLLRYNGVDSLLEYMVMNKQKELLKND